MPQARHGHTYSVRVGDHRVSYGDPTYRSWVAMRQRCYAPKHASYARYGGRGITVCERWNASFVAFLEDMGERPEGCSLDRIDNAGNYEPGNCRWSTRAEQMRNSRPALRDTCVNGHKYTPDNLRVKNGHRQCRACARNRQRIKLGISLDAPLMRRHQFKRPGITDATS